MSCRVKIAIHKSEVPNGALAIEYGAIPEGSSSAAPVMTHGASDLRNCFNMLWCLWHSRAAGTMILPGGQSTLTALITKWQMGAKTTSSANGKTW
jgi:hypothetical protein